MTREEAKAEINRSILSSWEQHFDQDAKDAIRRLEMIIDRIYDGFVGHEVKFQGDFKEPREGESLAKRLSRISREKRGVHGDTRGKIRVEVNINDGFIGHRVQPRQ